MKKSLLNEINRINQLMFVVKESSMIKVDCDTVISAIGYDPPKDTSVITDDKWYEYFGVNINHVNHSGIRSALNSLMTDTNNGQMKEYTFTNLELPINIQSSYYELKEESCCVFIKKGRIFNYDPKLNQDDDEKPTTDGIIRVLINKDDIEKRDCD